MAPEGKSFLKQQYYIIIDVTKTSQMPNASKNLHDSLLPWYMIIKFFKSLKMANIQW